MLRANRAVAALLENAALEGRKGIAVKALFETYHVGPPNDAAYRDVCWRMFLRATESSRTDDETPIRLHIPSASPDTIIANDITFDDAVARDVWVVACEALRFRALHLTAPFVMAEGSTAFLILEAVGMSRAKGLSTMDINSRIRENMLPRELESKKFDADLRSIHHYMDRLISQKLLVKKMVQITENFKCKRFNIVLLPRFDASFDLESTLPQSVMEDGPQWKNYAVDYLISYLKQQENHQSTFNDGMRAISLEKRRLEAMKNHIIVESKKAGSTFPMEIFTANRADTKQRFWCVRLRDHFVASMNAGETGWSADNGQDGSRSMIFHENGLVRQVYDAVVAAGPLGITSPDLKDKFGMYGKWPYRLLTLLTTSYHVRMEKTVIGRNSVYRLIATKPPTKTKQLTDAADTTAVVSRKRSLSPPASPVATMPPEAKKKRVHTHTLRHKPVADPPVVPSITDTTALRRLHILDRLKTEKVVSLYSLRSSIIEMENYAKDGRGFCSFNSGHRVDVRSIIRIVEASPHEMKLLHCDMPIKSSLTASGTKSSRVVLSADATDADLKAFLDAYARDSRIQTLNNKAFVNPDVMIQPNNPPSVTSIAYKLKDVLTAKSQVERDRENQSHILGKCHGFLYRCRLFHTYMFEYLQTAVDNPLLADVAAAHAPDRLFLLDPIFHSMTVTLYIRILGIGQLLLPDELCQLQAAVKANTKIADLAPTLYDKTTRHQSRRLTKLLRALIDLKVIKPHRLGHETLMSILQGTDAAGDLDLHRLVQYTLYDRVIGGFFIWHRDTRIYFSSTNDDQGWNEWPSVRVNATKFPYSFGHDVPLVHSFSTTQDVDIYWEALECCATEQLSYIPAPGQVMKLPPLISTEHINMVAAKNWTPNTHGVRYSRRDKKAPLPRIPGSNKVLLQRRHKKKDQPDGVHSAPLRRKSKKYKFVPRGARLDMHFTPEEDAAIMDIYLTQLQATWKVPVPVEMQVADEAVAIRGPQVYRTLVSTVVITRSAAPHRSVSRVRRRIDELLAKLPNKLKLLELKRSFFADTTFDEEVQIESNPRLGALVTRVFMILLTSDAAYIQMAAEHLVGAWTRQEIALVWRYFWLKGWIVVAKPFHVRGFVLTRRFHEIFKSSCTMSYPLDMFVEAAEHASFLATRTTDPDDDDDSFRCCGAVEHTALVLGQGHYQVRHTPLPEKPTAAKPQALKRRRDHRISSSGCGLLNHLDQSELDQWHATFIHASDVDPAPDHEVFSHQMEPFEPPLKRTKAVLKKRLVPFSQLERVLVPVEEWGMALDDLVGALGLARDVVKDSVEAYVEEDKLVAVHGWTCVLYVLRQFSEMWTAYPYTTTSRGTIQLDTAMGTTPHPWLKLNTQSNGPWLVRFQRKIVALLIKFPGCTEAAVVAGIEGVLPPQQVRLLLSDLVDEEVLYARIVRAADPAAFNLFATPAAAPQIFVPSGDTPLLQVDRHLFVVHYFPTPDCIVKYGQVAQEIDRL